MDLVKLKPLNKIYVKVKNCSKYKQYPKKHAAT